MNKGTGHQQQIALPFVQSLRFAFDSYIASRNGEAVAGLRRIAGGESGGNIYLWGRPGTGKSHLLQAVCRSARDRQRNAGYIPLNQIQDLAPALFHGLEVLDLLCIDDLECLAGKPEWELELFHLFNRMRDAGKPLIFASRQGPQEIAIQLQDLKSRLAWDLGYLLSPMEDDVIMRALQQRAAERSFALPDEIAQYIVTRCARDTHSLFRLLDRLDEASLVRQKKLTIPLVRELIDTEIRD